MWSSERVQSARLVVYMVLIIWARLPKFLPLLLQSGNSPMNRLQLLSDTLHLPGLLVWVVCQVGSSFSQSSWLEWDSEAVPIVIKHTDPAKMASSFLVMRMDCCGFIDQAAISCSHEKPCAYPTETSSAVLCFLFFWHFDKVCELTMFQGVF